MEDTSKEAPALLTPDEVAQRLRVSAATLAAWRATGRQQLPFVRVGGLPRYRPADVDAYVESRWQAA